MIIQHEKKYLMSLNKNSNKIFYIPLIKLVRIKRNNKSQCYKKKKNQNMAFDKLAHLFPFIPRLKTSICYGRQVKVEMGSTGTYKLNYFLKIMSYWGFLKTSLRCYFPILWSHRLELLEGTFLIKIKNNIFLQSFKKYFIIIFKRNKNQAL